MPFTHSHETEIGLCHHPRDRASFGRQWGGSAVYSKYYLYYHFLLMYSQIYLLQFLPGNLFSCRFWTNIHVDETNGFWPVPNNYYGDNYNYCKITLCFTSWAYCTFSPTAASLVGCLKNTESETKSKKVREREWKWVDEWMHSKKMRS